MGRCILSAFSLKWAGVTSKYEAESLNFQTVLRVFGFTVFLDTVGDDTIYGRVCIVRWYWCLVFCTSPTVFCYLKAHWMLTWFCVTRQRSRWCALYWTVTGCGMSVKMMLKLHQQQFIFECSCLLGCHCVAGLVVLAFRRNLVPFPLRSRNNLVFLPSVTLQKTWIFDYTGVETSNLAICHSPSISCVSVLETRGSGKFLSAAIMLASCRLPYYFF